MTLTELLVVILILVVLASVVFAVGSSSLRGAKVSDETARLRQIYLAVTLYEQDWSQSSPDSLVLLSPTYLPAKSLSSPSDARLATPRDDWPANPWVQLAVGLPGGDLEKHAALRTPTLNSYLYLKPFEGRLDARGGYAEARSNPRMGFLAGVGLMNCGATDAFDPDPSCKYLRKSPPGHPPENLFGTFVTLRTDGSSVTRQKPERCGSEIPFPVLFRFTPFRCGISSPVSPGP